MARKTNKKKTTAAPSLTRTVVRTTITFDQVITGEDDYNTAMNFANNGAYDIAYDAPVIVENIKTKTSVQTQTLKLPVQEA